VLIWSISYLACYWPNWELFCLCRRIVRPFRKGPDHSIGEKAGVIHIYFFLVPVAWRMKTGSEGLISRAAVFSLPGRQSSGKGAAERGASSPLYSAGSKTRRRSPTKHESSIPLTIRFELHILWEMLTRFNDADEGNQRKGFQRQARSIGRRIG